MRNDAKIFVAGHRGLVGSALVRRLREKGYNNLILRNRIELDLTNQQQTADFFRTEAPEYVILAAARVGGIVANSTYPAQFIYDNLMIQTNVIHQCYLNEVGSLIFLGSSCIYPKFCPQPIKESYLLTGELEPTNEPYSIAKIAGIKMCQSYNRQYGTRYLAVMPSNLYGPNDNFDLQTSHVLPALIRKFHLGKMAAERDWAGIHSDQALYGPIPDDMRLSLGIETRTQHSVNGGSPTPRVILWGSGEPRREFLHVDDLATACIFLLSLEQRELDKILVGLPAPLVNVGSGVDHSIRDLADLTAKIVDYRGSVRWDVSKPDGTPQKLLDVSLLTNLGWRPSIPISEGILETYNWYQAAKSAHGVKCMGAL